MKLVKIFIRGIGNWLILLLEPLIMLHLRFREKVALILCSWVHGNCRLVVDGSYSFLDAGGLSSLCF